MIGITFDYAETRGGMIDVVYMVAPGADDILADPAELIDDARGQAQASGAHVETESDGHHIVVTFERH